MWNKHKQQGTSDVQIKTEISVPQIPEPDALKSQY